MFSCSACFRRTLRALLSDLPRTNSSPAPFRRHTRNALSSLRPHSTLQALRKGHHKQVLRKALAKKRDDPSIRNNKRRNGPLPGEVRDVLARENNRKHLALQESSATNSTQFQLQWLQDPLKLANAVTERLRIGDDQAALELIRGSEKPVYVDGQKKGGQVDNVVSWNHVIDYYMYKGNTQEALKVFNEMKKRGHRPEAQTYTLLLSGFARNIKKPNAVARAISVYNSIFAPNSTVKPSTIHTNAVINVCARGGDMDNLWAIAGRLPERGPGAADKITYTNILNALRSDAERRSQQVGAGLAISRNILDKAVQDGEKLWLDVNKRWRNGNLMIDEALTCAMGRLLLLGTNPEHWNNVFALVEQTMRLPQYEESQHTSTQKQMTDASESNPIASLDTDSSLSVTNISPEFEGSGDLANRPAAAYARPSNNTLSMLLQACILTRNLAAGKYYWNLLTSSDGDYRISSDSENLAQYLRLLRISRSSKLARDLLYQTRSSDQATKFFMRGNFIIAMSTCVRDKNNPNVFEYATDIFELMQKELHGIDAKVMHMYLEVASVTTPGFGYRPGTMEVDPAKSNVLRVLSRYETFLPEIQEMIASKIREEQYDALSNKRRKKLQDPHDDPDRTYQDKNSLFDLLRTMVSVYDRIIMHEGIPETLARNCMVRKSRLTTFITKMAPGESARRKEKTIMYSERELGATELESQEQRLLQRARGISGPKKPHVFPPQRKDSGVRYSSQGWESGFASIERQDSSRARDFINLGP